MSGRTDRVNARELLNRTDGILFEGEAVRGWVDQLAKRAKGTLDAAKRNKVIEEEWRPERDELALAVKALHNAFAELKVFEAAVSRREGK